MWRRVSCEQPLNTSQSILRLRGSLLYETCNTVSKPKGKLVHIPEPGAEPFRTSYLSWQREPTRRRPPELWEELSFLHKPPRPWNPLAGRMGFGFGKECRSSRGIHERPVGP